MIAFGVLLGVLWTVSGAVLYRSYTRALADQMRRSPLGTSTATVAEDDTALQALLRSDDARDVRLGLDLLQGVASTASTPALRHASEHPDPAVRVQALLHLADGGDAAAGGAVARLARELAASADPADRCAAAAALGSSAMVANGRAHAREPARRRRPSGAGGSPGRGPAGRRRRWGDRRVERSPRSRCRALQAAPPPRSGGSADPPSRSSRQRLPASRRRDRPSSARAAHAASGNGLAVIEPALAPP